MKEMRVSTLLETYMAEYAEREIVSVLRTRSAVKTLCAGLGHIDHSRITLSRLRGYRKAEGLAPASVNREFAVLRAALHWAVEHQLIRNMPDIPKRPGAGKRMIALLPHEIKTLIAEAERYQGVLGFILLTLTTGQRLQAVLGLRWEQVDWGGEGRESVVWFSNHGLQAADRRKGRGDVPVTPELGEILRVLREGNNSPWVLTNRYGARYDDVNRKQWHEVTAAAGLTGLVPHDLRHTVATELIRQQVPLIEISRLLGHANTRVTESIYVKREPKQLVGAASRLGELVRR